jgi:hypothetical protein
LEPPEDAPLIGIFGDSIVQGATTDSLVNHVEVAGCAAVNGGVEGSTLDAIIGRFEDLQKTGRMICAVVHPGFHNLVYSETSFVWWENQFARLKDVPVIALVKLTADLHPDAIKQGYAQYYGEHYYETHFSLPHVAPSLQIAIDKKNQLIERYAERRGFLVVDLDPILLPKRLEDVTKNFFDIIHPTTATYPQIGPAIAEVIRPHVQKALAAGFTPGSKAPAAPRASIAEVMQNQGRNYPLW